MRCGGGSGEYATLGGSLSQIKDDEPFVVDLQLANWAETALFPIILLLPLKVATEIRSARSYRILDRDEGVPVAILNWMKADNRYINMFDEG